MKIEDTIGDLNRPVTEIKTYLKAALNTINENNKKSTTKNKKITLNVARARKDW